MARERLGAAILRELTRRGLDPRDLRPTEGRGIGWLDFFRRTVPYSEEEVPDSPFEETVPPEGLPPLPPVGDGPAPYHELPPELPGDTIETPPAPPPVFHAPEDVYFERQRGTTAFVPRESQTPRALRGGLPPALAALHSLLRIPAPRSRKKRRGSSADSAARPRTARARTHLPGLPGTSAIFGSALSFRGPPVRSPGLPSEPYPIVTDPRGPVLWPSTRRQREGRPRTLEEALENLHRTNPYDMNPLPELPRRRIITPPSSPPSSLPPAPLPEALPMPQPTIPAPRVPQPAPLPLPRTPAPSPLGLPRPPSPASPRPVKTAPVRIATPGLAAATVGLSTILRRKSQAATSLLRYYTAPFDPALQPVGDVFPPTIGDRLPQPLPPTIARPDTLPDINDNPLDLTRRNELQLGLAPRDRREREECCKCDDEEEEEEKKTPRPSRIVATVRSFARRMSQNSLDNLR